MNPPEPLRAFISIAPPPPLRHAIAQLRTRFHLPPTVRWTPEEQIHLTLRFIGNIPPTESLAIAAQLQHACASFRPFPLRIQSIGAFPTPQRPRVLWIGLHGNTETLRQLQEAVRQHTAKWGKPDEHPFHPHLTVARVRPPIPKPLRSLLQKPPVENLGDWSVTQVDLMRSTLTPHGAVHSLLHRIGL